MFSFLVTFTLKQVDTRERCCLKWKRKNDKASNNLPRTSHPPASLLCTVRSHCKDSVLDFCSFFQFCSPLSDHQCTRVYKAHSDKIPARSEDKTGAKDSELWAKLLWPYLLLYVLDGARIKWDPCLLLLRSMFYKILWVLGKTPQDWKLQQAT